MSIKITRKNNTSNFLDLIRPGGDGFHSVKLR